MDKRDHGLKLKAAMAARGYGRQEVADAAGVQSRTVTNWTSGATMPSPSERGALRRLLGDYDSVGDPVEVAIHSSALDEWRQDAVLSFYKRNLHEQAAEGRDIASRVAAHLGSLSEQQTSLDEPLKDVGGGA